MKGIMTDERIVKDYLSSLDLIKKIDNDWGIRFELLRKESLENTLRRRKQNREAGGKTTPER